jgi:APA family basic amino acid/polyamine antiporter
MTKDDDRSGLRRSLGLALLVFYGLGIIIGAGVYVAVGDVVKAAGPLAASSFVLAGVIATLTALSYAELGARFPEAAGAAAYVKEAFLSDRFSTLTGVVVAIVVLISAATIARGTAGYAQTFVALPEWLIAGALVIAFTGVACLGVRDSTRMAAVMTIVELAGLGVVIAVGSSSLPNLVNATTNLVPVDANDWTRVLAGAFVAFFAFTGFENLANMAEEAKNVARTIPLAILISLGISTTIYVAVALVVLAVVPLEEIVTSAAPLLLVITGEREGISRAFSAVALVAVSNGVLIQILVLARLLYGMARRSLLPEWLSRVSGVQVPLRATMVAGTLILISTLALPFHTLLRVSTTLTILLFVLVNLALCRLHYLQPAHHLTFRVPVWVPYLATLSNVLLIAAQFF